MIPNGWYNISSSSSRLQGSLHLLQTQKCKEEDVLSEVLASKCYCPMIHVIIICCVGKI